MTGTQPEVAAAALATAFAELRATFDRAAEQLGISRHRLRVGPKTIELQIAGAGTASVILPALQHLIEPESSETPQDLTIRAWNTLESDTRLPDLPGLLEGVVMAQYDGEISLSVRMFESTVCALHAGRREAVHCVADVGRVEPYNIAHPLSEIFAWALSRSGCYRVHAAAVGNRTGGVLLAGPSGAGKSTSALTCLRAGMSFAGDDTVLVRADPPTAISLYNTGRADRNLLQRYPDAFPRLELASGEEKSVGFFSRDTMTREIRLRAVVLPRVVPGGRCRIAAARRATAMLALSPWAVLHSPGVESHALASIRNLLAALPVYALEIGDDLDQIPMLLSEVIEGTPPCS